MLLDSSGLLCLLSQAEPQHPEAARLYRDASRRLTHNYVLAEFVALTIARKVPRARALEFVRKLLENSRAEVVWVDVELHQAAMELLAARLDKAWSLCDAVSFVLMRRAGVSEALTTDRHFEQADFVRLLRP